MIGCDVVSSAAPGFEAVATSTRKKFRSISGSGTFFGSRREAPPLKESTHAPRALCTPYLLFRTLQYKLTSVCSPLPQSTDSFGKSNVAYITWIVGGILVAEGFTGGMTDMLWSSANSGRLYESVDWTKFVVEDDDDDDEDDEEDEDEDEEEGDDDDEE